MSPSLPKTQEVTSAELRSVLEHALVGVCVIDASTFRARWCNPAFLRFVAEPFRTLGVAGRHATEFIPRYVDHGYEQVFRLVAESGRPFVNPEDEHRDAAARARCWRWSLTAVGLTAEERGTGCPACLMIQAVEITDQVKARRQVAAAESASRHHAARTAAILDSTDEGIVVADAAGNILHINPP